jgi:hypothetical protein
MTTEPSPFDMRAFVMAVGTIQAARGVTDDVMCAEAGGLAPSSITRMRQGRSLSISSIALLADWSGLSLDVFMQRRNPVASPLADAQRRAIAAIRASEVALTLARSMLNPKGESA